MFNIRTNSIIRQDQRQCCIVSKKSWCALICSSVKRLSYNKKLSLIGHTLKLMVDDVELSIREDEDITFHIP